jgi:hypothetical protein
MSRKDGTNVQGANEYLYHPATKETIGEEESGGKLTHGRDY